MRGLNGISISLNDFVSAMSNWRSSVQRSMAGIGGLSANIQSAVSSITSSFAQIARQQAAMNIARATRAIFHEFSYQTHMTIARRNDIIFAQQRSFLEQAASFIMDWGDEIIGGVTTVAGGALFIYGAITGNPAALGVGLVLTEFGLQTLITARLSIGGSR